MNGSWPAKRSKNFRILRNGECVVFTLHASLLKHQPGTEGGGAERSVAVHGCVAAVEFRGEGSARCVAL
eukprot:107140-Pyramimonas_sp.AAC.1